MCLNCARGGRVCEGFLRPAGQRLKTAPIFVAIQPRVSCNLSALQHQPSLSLQLSEAESRYLYLFRSITANKRSGFYNSGFWTRTILQASHFSPAVNHSLIAIGALFQCLEASAKLPLDTRCTSATTAAHYDFAVRQYSKAIRLNRQSFDDGAKISLRTALISCVLFNCFESFHGDQKAAISQIYSGLKLLEDRQHNASLLKSRCNDDSVEDDLIQMFRDTANSIATYNMAFYRNMKLPSFNSSIDPADATPFAEIPAAFSNLEEARRTWESLKKSTLKFVMSILHTVDGRYHAHTTDVTTGRSSIAALIERCSVAMQPLLQRARNTPDFLAVNATYLDLKMSLILFHFTFETDETYLDGYSADFEQLLNLAETVIDYQGQTPDQATCHDDETRRGLESNAPPYLAQPQAQFAFDTTIIYPLFYVGTRCRISSVRRRAIALLRSTNRREGLWDSGLAAKVAQLVMEIEEEGREAGGEIPEAKRITLREVEFEDDGRVAVVSLVSKGGASRMARFLV